MEFSAKQQSSVSLENKMNRKSKKYNQETVWILYDSLRMVVSVWVWLCVWVCAYECVLCINVCLYEFKLS